MAQRLQDELHPSQAFTDPGAAMFLKTAAPVEQLFNSILAAASPEQYSTGFRAIEAVKSLNLHNHSALWPSVYSGLTVIADRETPLHRDDGASISHFDLLFSAGVHNKAELRLPDVGTVLDYDPGTVVLLAGRALAHSVPRTWVGHRVCWAHYMKDKVHDKLGIP